MMSPSRSRLTLLYFGLSGTLTLTSSLGYGRHRHRRWQRHNTSTYQKTLIIIPMLIQYGYDYWCLLVCCCIVALSVLLNPSKPAEDSTSYRPVSFLCPAIEILERLIHRGIKLQRCQQGCPSPFCTHQCSQLPPNCTCVLFPLLVSFVSGCTDFVSCFFLHHATAHTMTMMMNYYYLSR